MNQLASASAILLAALFVWAAWSKLRRPALTAESFGALGLPAAAALARAVPAVELATAALLLIRPRVGGLAALALLVAFTAVLHRALAAADRQSGTTVRCGCFGSSDDAPVSGVTVLRNAFLAVAALLAAAAHRLDPSAPALMAAGCACVTAMVVLALGQVRLTTGSVFPSARGVS